jgi:hypothetical protein
MQLKALGIPFMFATGYGEQTRLPDELRDLTVVQKPYTLATLSRRLGELLGVVVDPDDISAVTATTTAASTSGSSTNEGPSTT